MLRICSIPVLVTAIQKHRFPVAFALFVIAASTDVIDGLLARWLHQRTRFGQYLDPVADKLMLSSLFVVLTFEKILNPAVALLVFGRDLGMLLSAAIIFRLANVRNFRPTLLGKANSFSQIVAVGTVLLTFIDPAPWVALAQRAALDTTIILTVLSGFHYGWVASQRIDAAVEAQTAFKTGRYPKNLPSESLPHHSLGKAIAVSRQPGRIVTS